MYPPDFAAGDPQFLMQYAPLGSTRQRQRHLQRWASSILPPARLLREALTPEARSSSTTCRPLPAARSPIRRRHQDLGLPSAAAPRCQQWQVPQRPRSLHLGLPASLGRHQRSSERCFQGRPLLLLQGPWDRRQQPLRPAKRQGCSKCHPVPPQGACLLERAAGRLARQLRGVLAWQAATRHK